MNSTVFNVILLNDFTCFKDLEERKRREMWETHLDVEQLTHVRPYITVRLLFIVFKRFRVAKEVAHYHHCKLNVEEKQFSGNASLESPNFTFHSECCVCLLQKLPKLYENKSMDV